MSGTRPPGQLRIGLVAPPFVPGPPPRYGGTELVVEELARGLVALGHDVTLFGTGDSAPPCRLRAGIPRAVWPPDERVERAHAAWAAAAIDEDVASFDLVHAHTPAFLEFADLLPDLPVVHTLHLAPDGGGAAAYARGPARVQHVAISRRQRALYPALARCVVVPHGLDEARYRTASPEPYLAFLGRLSEVKGPDVAVRAARRAGLELRVAGRPHEADGAFFRATLRDLLAEPHVRRLGEVGHEAKVELLARAAALLFPIGWEEPFGLVMIEAMLCGCPVLAFRGGAVDEVIEPGLTGFVAEDERHLAWLARHAAPRLDRAARRARAVARFSRDRMVDRYLAVYRRVLAEVHAPAWTEAPLAAGGPPEPPG